MALQNEPNLKAALDAAANLIKQGNISGGKEELEWVLQRDPENSLAWLWMSRCVEARDEKLRYFYKVLSIDPDNRHALEGIQRFGGTTPMAVPVTSAADDIGAPADRTTQRPAVSKWPLYAAIGITILLVGAIIAYALLQPQLGIRGDGPSTGFLISDFTRDGISDVSVLHKGKCDPLSPTAEARGIKEAWLVLFDYDSRGIGHIAEFPVLYGRADGDWGRLSGYYDDSGWPRCP